MQEAEVGLEVQSYNEAGETLDGVVTAVTPAKRKLEDHYWKFTAEEQTDMYPTVTVKFDNGTEETLSVNDLDDRDTELERKFRLLCDSAGEEIQAELNKACDHLSKAVKISEKYGVPFSSGISFLSQSYFPGSFNSQFEDIDKEFVSGLTDAYSEYGEGWEHSAVC